MPLKGFEKWRAHLPDYSGKRIYRILISFPINVVIVLFIFYCTDNIVRWLPQIPFLIILEPWIPILMIFGGLIGGFEIVHLIWNKKEFLITKEKGRAYQKALSYPFIGIPLLFATILHGFFPITYFPLHLFNIPVPRNVLTINFTTSMIVLGWEPTWDWIPQFIFAGFFVFLAVLSAFRSVIVFGIDNAMLTYLYYPKEGEIVTHQIYGIVRHPMYVGLFLLGFATLISRCSFYSLILFITLTIMLAHHIHVEENELIQRFGDSYITYRKSVPAIFIHPKHWKAYLLYLFKGKSN